MEKITLLQTDDHVTRLCYGCMRIAGTWNPHDVDAQKQQAAYAALDAAMEAGFTFFDHADIYCAGKCEELFGEWLAANPSIRETLFIATKCGIRFGGSPRPDSPQRYDFSKEWILESAEGSLQRLGIDKIDLYQLHRPDFLADPYEIAEAFSELRDSGKVRHFGVSNFRPSLVAAIEEHLDFPLISNQVEIHLLKLDTLEDGTLDQCLQFRMTPLAWSPLGQGRLGSEARPGLHDPKIIALHGVMDNVAKAYGTTRAELAVAWLLKHPANIIPIIGSTNPQRIAAAPNACDIALSRDDWYRLLHIARGERLP